MPVTAGARRLLSLTVREIGGAYGRPARAVAITEEVFGETYPVERPPVEYLEALAADVLDAR